MEYFYGPNSATLYIRICLSVLTRGLLITDSSLDLHLLPASIYFCRKTLIYPFKWGYHYIGIALLWFNDPHHQWSSKLIGLFTGQEYTRMDKKVVSICAKTKLNK